MLDVYFIKSINLSSTHKKGEKSLQTYVESSLRNNIWDTRDDVT